MKIAKAALVLFTSCAFAGPLESELKAMKSKNDEGQIRGIVQMQDAAKDAAEFSEIMTKAAQFSPDTGKIIGAVPQANDLEPGSDYVHKSYDAVETSGSVIFDYWNAYKSGPMYFKTANEVCKVRKMTYLHSYAWSKKNDGSTLVFYCYEKDEKGAANETRAFKISYGQKGEINEVQNNLNGNIGTRTTINSNGKFVY